MRFIFFWAKWNLRFFFSGIFYSSRKYIYSNCFSTKQLDFFEKMWKWAQKWSFAQNVPLFLPIFTDFWAKSDDPFCFGRFWPHFLFLQEICLFELFFYETTRFFWKNVKTGSKMEFCPKQNPLFLPIFTYFFVFLITISLEDF